MSKPLPIVCNYKHATIKFTVNLSYFTILAATLKIRRNFLEMYTTFSRIT